MNFVKAPGNCLRFLMSGCPRICMLREGLCKKCDAYVKYPAQQPAKSEEKDK